MTKKNSAVAPDPENDGREDDGMTEEIVQEAGTSALATEVDYSSYGAEHKKHGIALKASEVIIPMFKIVQKSSEIFKHQDLDNPVCKEGDIYNSVTKQVYPNGVLIVPMDCSVCVIERKPSPDGSFIARLEERDPRVQAAYKDNGDDGWMKLTSKQKTQLVYTEEVPVGLIDPEDPDNVYGVALIPFSGTNVFPRRQWWNTMAEAPFASVTPRYAFRTLLTTVLRKAKTSGGVDSFKFQTQPYHRKGVVKATWGNCRLPPNHPTLNRCLDFLKLYQTGTLGKADYSDKDTTDHESAAEASILGDKPVF